MHAEAYRAAKLREQVATWRDAHDIAAYLTALMDAHEDNAGTGEWVRWISDYATLHDPLQSAPQMPDVPEPTPDELRPFLRGVSPYGPSRLQRAIAVAGEPDSKPNGVLLVSRRCD